MTFRSSAFPIAAILAVAVAIPGVAVAQQRGTQAQRSENVRAAADLRARIGTTEARIGEAQRSRAITRARAATLRRQVAQTRASMTRLARQQGFVSAAEFASYNRTLGAIDVELDRRGVARSYGNDMLVAPAATDDAEFRYDCQNDPIRFAIPGDRLEVALNQLRLATHCPISGTELARGKRSRPVVGTLTPIAALRTMLGGTGLNGAPIRQGLTITRERR